MKTSKNNVWNKGLPSDYQPFFGKRHTTKSVQKMSAIAILRHKLEPNWGFQKGNQSTKGMHIIHSGTFKKGQKPWNYGNNSKVTVTCITCGKSFKVNPNMAKNRKYCTLKCRDISPIWIAGIRDKRLNQRFLRKETSLEKKMEVVLQKLNIDYEKQYPIKEARCIPDFVILDKHLAIFVDGTYWHSGKRIETDIKQQKLLTENGWNFVRYVEECFQPDKYPISIEHDLERRLE